MSKKGPKMVGFFWPWRAKFWPFLTIFCKSLLNIPRNIILKNQKNSLTRKIFKSEKLRKWPKKGQKCPLFGPGGSNFDPFFTIFCKSLLNMSKNIILKNKRILLYRKIFNSKKMQTLTKKGQKLPVFLALEGRTLQK